jgi:hypothetical protein
LDSLFHFVLLTAPRWEKCAAAPLAAAAAFIRFYGTADCSVLVTLLNTFDTVLPMTGNVAIAATETRAATKAYSTRS